ncbi:MAG: hypothetical protein JXX29_16420, partial [Deltaproteobacteria bacterium]|nr:hypothetical protein [Deltaproteobacteria bacterium]MBN2673269.1 hypothetical protein [Deltaproteobacteria bacterium]
DTDTDTDSDTDTDTDSDTDTDTDSDTDTDTDTGTDTIDYATANCTILYPQATVYDGAYLDTDSSEVVPVSDEVHVLVSLPGLTDQAGNSGAILAQAGYGSRFTDPSGWVNWQTASYLKDSCNPVAPETDTALSDCGSDTDVLYDTFASTFVGVDEGVYFFAFRISFDSGSTWMYCDTTWTTVYDDYNVIEGGIMSVTDHDCWSNPDPSGYECDDCEDNDKNGLVDGFDPKCLFADDRVEVDFTTNIPGDETTAVTAPFDCFVDGNSGGSTDNCNMHSCCDLFDPQMDDYFDFPDVPGEMDNPPDPNCQVDCPAVCGDGLCGYMETYLTCPEDCLETCGNMSCETGLGESAYTCSADCANSCGDGYCTHSEDYEGCDTDCGELCGDGSCQLGHPECDGYDRSDCLNPDTTNYITNPVDFPDKNCVEACVVKIPPGCDCWGCCTVCIDNECENIYTSPQVSPECNDDTFHDPSKCLRCEQKFEDASVCPTDCGDTCGDGYCTGTETYSTCSQDCAAACGDTVCDTDTADSDPTESAATCPADCTTPVCGDGLCDASEVGICQDCAPSCGDETCGLQCGHACDPSNCIICPGMTADDLPSECDSEGNQCPNGWDSCASQSECPAGSFCGFGCCIPQD